MIYMSAKVRAVARVLLGVVVRTVISANLPASDKENCGRRARMEVMRHQARYCVHSNLYAAYGRRAIHHIKRSLLCVPRCGHALAKKRKLLINYRSPIALTSIPCSALRTQMKTGSRASPPLKIAQLPLKCLLKFNCIKDCCGVLQRIDLFWAAFNF